MVPWKRGPKIRRCPHNHPLEPGTNECSICRELADLSNHFDGTPDPPDDDFEVYDPPIDDSSADEYDPRLPRQDLEERRNLDKDEDITDPGDGVARSHHKSVIEDDDDAVVNDRRDASNEEKTIVKLRKGIIGWIAVVSGSQAGIDFRLTNTAMRIGKNDACEIPLQDDQCISNFHAEIVLKGSQYMIHDLESLNGTEVNRQRITEHYLRDGDRIDIGRTGLIFKCCYLLAQPEAGFGQGSISRP